MFQRLECGGDTAQQAQALFPLDEGPTPPFTALIGILEQAAMELSMHRPIYSPSVHSRSSGSAHPKQ